jgi:hypothetical protein
VGVNGTAVTRDGKYVACRETFYNDIPLWCQIAKMNISMQTRKSWRRRVINEHFIHRSKTGISTFADAHLEPRSHRCLRVCVPPWVVLCWETGRWE